MKAHLLVVILLSFLVAACGDDANEANAVQTPVRGLITTVVEAAEETTRRRYPGVLEPTNITALSFEVAGKLEKLELEVGQRVSKGEVLAKVENTQFAADVESKIASVAEAKALLKQAEDKLTRTRTLFERKVSTRVAVDDAETSVRTNQTSLTRAERALDNARKDLTKTDLYAPFDGIINSVDAESFQTVSVGAKVTSVYEATSYEVSFSVNFTTVSRLVVGTPAIVRLADDPNVRLAAVVSELGERADTVSSFPVVVQLKDNHPIVRAGMAVEVNLEFKLPTASGFLIPITAAIADKAIPERSAPDEPTKLDVFVFDSDSSAVKRRSVTMAGIRENQFLIVDGLKPGERVASAGVSFLRDGMKVKLLQLKE
ncbi:MAG: efflux RND transporter periplasmic adaptor subunit [Pseudomonadota bacterium]